MWRCSNGGIRYALSIAALHAFSTQSVKCNFLLCLLEQGNKPNWCRSRAMTNPDNRSLEILFCPGYAWKSRYCIRRFMPHLARIHLQQSFHFLCVPLPGACKHEIFHGPDSSWNESVHLLMQLLGCTVVVWCFTCSPLFELNMIYSTSFTRLKWCFILLVRAWMNRASQGVEMRGKFGGCQVLFFFPYRSFSLLFLLHTYLRFKTNLCYLSLFHSDPFALYWHVFHLDMLFCLSWL